MLRDLVDNFKTALSIVPQIVTADVNGVGVDTRGFESCMAIVTSGAISVAGLVLPTLQESDDNAAFTNVAAADRQGTAFVNLEASTIYKLGYIGSKRYVRIFADYVSGTSVAVSAEFVLGHPNQRPVA